MNHKGNQKHLTLDQRIEIEKELTENKSFSAIAKLIGKDPSTISKEVRLHAKTKERPYVCNGCGKKTHCLMPRQFYSSKYANDCYRDTLVSSREGINQTPESIQKMNDILTPLLKEKKQSIAHVYATHVEDTGCSRRSLYIYIDMGIFEVRNIDLCRRVTYKK